MVCEDHIDPGQEGIRWMQLSRERWKLSVEFDDPTLLCVVNPSCALLGGAGRRCGQVDMAGVMAVVRAR